MYTLLHPSPQGRLTPICPPGIQSGSAPAELRLFAQGSAQRPAHCEAALTPGNPTDATLLSPFVLLDEAACWQTVLSSTLLRGVECATLVSPSRFQLGSHALRDRPAPPPDHASSNPPPLGRPGRGVSGRGGSRPSPDWLLRAGQPQFSARWRRGWREQLAPCGPLRRWDSPEGGLPLGQKSSWEGGLRAETGTACGEPGSRDRQVGVKDSTGTLRGRAGAEAVRTRGGLELERSVRAARPGRARAS